MNAAVAIKERPILFSGPMVRAILDGKKSQTRRVLKPQPDHLQFHSYRGKVLRDAEHRMWCWKDLVLDNILDFPDGSDRKTLASRCSYGQPGDRLWVRETTQAYQMPHLLTGEPTENWGGKYVADDEAVLDEKEFDLAWWYSRKTCPPIHMPRWASRITLEITDVRVQRLQEITEKDAAAEGIRYEDGSYELEWMTPAARDLRRLADFAKLWDSINGKTHPWESNPWVWVLTLKRAEAP